MAITDPQALAFTGNRIRPMADVMATSYFTAKSLVDEWNATGMSSLITNDSSVISESSLADGRHSLTGAQATAIITRAEEIIADYEATSNAKLNTVMLAKINGQAKF